MPGKIYEQMITFDGNQQQLVDRYGGFVCTCIDNKAIDCFTDQIKPAYPGETITIYVTLLPPHPETTVHIDSSQVLNDSISPPCEVLLPKVYLVSNKCTPLYYKIKSKFSKACFYIFKADD